jgi:hypothetical protein
VRAYKHLLGYLERYTLVNFKRIHIRFHRIKRPDITPFLHTHPFDYLSIVLWGGYTECLENREISHGKLSFIFRKKTTAHRIVAVRPGTLTLFFTWKSKEKHWEFKDCPVEHPAPDWINYPEGVYARELYGRTVYSKFDKYWHRAAQCMESAKAEHRPSIDQSSSGEWVSGLA